MYPKGVRNLIECFKTLPGIGEKSAERLAFSMINFEKDRLTFFSDSILEIRDKIGNCSICGNICEGGTCNICDSKSRDKNIIFVVEKAKDIFLFEKLGVFNGTYHVLGGLISPLDGINPEDINIDALEKRINNGEIMEVILALKPSIEGETTMQYIKKVLEKTEIKVSKIATGIPLGTDMEYIDTLTLELALEERKDISK